MSSRSFALTAIIALLGISIAVAQEPEKAAPARAQEPEFKSIAEKISYVIGLRIGRNLKNEAFRPDVRMIAKGIEDVLAENKPLLDAAQETAVMSAFQKELRQKEAQKALAADPKLKAISEKNQAEGKAFTEANAKKEGVKTTASGLQYEVVKAAEGATPKATDQVKTHYLGTLVDGTKFDSSYDRNEPAVFPVQGVIPGWVEALQLMKVGEKWRICVPPELAYGLTGAGDLIGPNATLVFEIELLEIVK